MLIVLGAFFAQVPRFFYAYAALANDSGYVALVLIAGTGVLMVFRKSLLRATRRPNLLRALHVGVGAVGGAFLVVHVAFFLTFPVSVAVLYGYVATYVAFFVWVTGLLFIEGLRSSVYYHGILSLLGVSLMVLHVFDAGRGIPLFDSGILLVLIASCVIIGAVVQILRLPKNSA